MTTALPVPVVNKVTLCWNCLIGGSVFEPDKKNMTMQATQGRETKLSRTFGDELCTSRWLSFKSHYHLVIRANLANNIERWQDGQYRAIQLRLQITGEPESWLNQAEQSGEAWVEDGDAIVERFDRRFVTGDGIELAIRQFEEARQEDGEDIGPFMSRLRRLAGHAFGLEEEDSRRSRVVWKFVSGLKDDSVRRDVIRQKWMADNGKAKQYDVILATAQDALGVIRATEASGPSVATVHQNAIMAAVEDLSRRVDSVMALDSGARRGARPQQRAGSAGGSNRRQATRVLRCWYCSREHPGGYRSCRKRAQEMPNWQPTQRTTWGANGLMASPERAQQQFF